MQLPVSALSQYHPRRTWHAAASSSSRTQAPTVPVQADSSACPHVSQTNDMCSIQQQREHQQGLLLDVEAVNGTQHTFSKGAAAAGHSSGTTAGAEQVPAILLQLLARRMRNLTSMCLHHNSISTPSALGCHLQQLQLVSQITALELRDSCSWGLPCTNLAHISALTHLQKLQWLVQSPGMPINILQSHMALPPVAVGWQQRVSMGFAVVQQLTRLRHLQLRCICGERGRVKV